MPRTRLPRVPTWVTERNVSSEFIRKADNCKLGVGPHTPFWIYLLIKFWNLISGYASTDEGGHCGSENWQIEIDISVLWV